LPPAKALDTPHANTAKPDDIEQRSQRSRLETLKSRVTSPTVAAPPLSRSTNRLTQKNPTGGGTLTTEHRIGTQEEWQAARDELLKEEKELTRRGDELARKRRELPWVPVEKDYEFDSDAGTKSLADLFDGRSQLLVYHFMFGPTWEAGCPVCTSIADTLAPQVPHLKARDTTLLLASRAPIAKLLAYRKRMGWGIGWVSSGRSDFNRDLGFLHTKEELRPFLEGPIPPTVEQNARMCGTDAGGYVSEGPGLSAYALSDGKVYRTYVTTARGLEVGMGYYALLDRTPKGRDESATEPSWVRRHDEYARA
jgi:predicted dithiol-disulfide oxidoreductase (DUF899 family)